MTTVRTQLDPRSYVARIIEELEGNPEARVLLMRALLTDEFLKMPPRVERMEEDIAGIKRDVSILKGDSLEWKLFKRIRPLVSQTMNLRRSRIMLSSIREARAEIEVPMLEAVEKAVITNAQEMRVSVTDFVLRAVHNEDSSQIWIAVEASNNIGQRDIERVKESADALSAVFGDAVGVVAGYRIHPRDQERADESGVRILLVEENFWIE